MSLFKTNTGNPDESMVSYHTSTYATGYMVGDIRGAWLANNATDDKCVKGNDLSTTGTIDEESADGGTGELQRYYGFSASDYLGSNANFSDLDFGTGDFSIMYWVKWTADSTNSQVMVDRGSTARFLVYDPSSGGKPQLYVTDGTTTPSSIATANDYDDGNWHQIVALRRSDDLYIYVDGVDAQTTSVASTQDLDDGSAIMRVGVNISNADPLNGSLSLLRISATAPTPQQIKEIYEAEKPLFAANAKCLLAANQVNDLAYDKTSGLLHVASESTASSKSFRGLEAVESLTSDGSLGLTAATEVDGITAAGGVIAAYDNAKAGVNLPSIDVRASLLEGESKLPDDGKLHFSGVTTDATPTIIGQIPIGENEFYTVNAKVTATRYNMAESGAYHSSQIKESFYRAFSGNVTSRGEITKLTDEGTTSLDFDMDVVTGSQTITAKVTGYSGTGSMVWTAEVEVQRISDKTYER
ncbi:MAG: LamG domain-containing protein [Planctomycetaceae bacterium]|nr:LamG domain-containing protein [Planctomycetaceae bacterium]